MKYFVIYPGESIAQALKEHGEGYHSVESAITDMLAGYEVRKDIGLVFSKKFW